MSKLLRLDRNALASNPRATLRCWERHKPIVLAAMAIHPKPYIYDAKDLSAASVVTKLRDAVRGCLCFSYDPERYEALRSWFHEVVFRANGKSVIIGPPSRELSVLEVEASGSTNALSFASLTPDEISAFTLLLSHSRIHGPIIIQHPPGIADIAERVNVEVVLQEDGSIVLL